jgi:hypothetical protein
MASDDKPRRVRAKDKAPSEPEAKRAKDKTAREQKKDDAKTERDKTADARKERRFKTQEKRQGEKRVRETVSTGNKECRTKRREEDTPHREALAKNKIDFDACRNVVAGSASRIFFEEVAPLGPVIARLDRMIPSPVPNPRARHNQELWTERLDQARADILHQHPELAANLEQLLGPVGKFGSRHARELRATTDRLIGGRPAMTIAELVAQRAHDAGFTPGSGLAGGAPSFQRAAESAAARSVRTLMEAGPPPSLQEILARVGPSSAAAPSQVTPSALAFPPPSGSASTTWAPGSGVAAGWSPASGLPPERGSTVEELIAAATSSRRATPASRRATPASRPARRARAARAARGKGPRDREPRTKASPGSEPRPPEKKARKRREKTPGKEET